MPEALSPTTFAFVPSSLSNLTQLRSKVVSLPLRFEPVLSELVGSQQCLPDMV